MRPWERIGDGADRDAPLDWLKACGAFYETPKDAAGKRLGPLVGYAGRDADGRQYVGEVYVNVARAERHPSLLRAFSRRLSDAMRGRHLGPTLDAAAGYCGAPEGGKAFAYQLALDAGRDYIYPEKRIVAAAGAASREATELVFDRHEPAPGQSWFIVEDVCNNFSTTAQLVALIEARGARVAGVLCILNRSALVDTAYVPRPGLDLPVVSVVRHVFGQYDQSDPCVADDVAANNVAWSPKRDWPRLARAMRAAS